MLAVYSYTSGAGHIRERNFLSHGSLKRERGVGNLRDASRKGHLTGEGPGLGWRSDISKISQSPNRTDQFFSAAGVQLGGRKKKPALHGSSSPNTWVLSR